MSPATTTTSASVAICDRKACRAPADDLPKCRSAVAASRMQLLAATCVPSWHLSCLRQDVTPETVQAPSRHASDFYRRIIHIFQEAGMEFLVGGAYALVHYTGIGRDTKDLDLFIRRADWERATSALAEEGIATELSFPHWLGKAYGGRQREFF